MNVTPYSNSQNINIENLLLCTVLKIKSREYVGTALALANTGKIDYVLIYCYALNPFYAAVFT